jgi:hypothetical protein
MKEVCILRTTELYSTRGVVHIRTLGYDGEETYIEYDARALLEDIPHLYQITQQAIKEDDEYELTRYVNFKKQLAEDWKGKRGRKK